MFDVLKTNRVAALLLAAVVAAMTATVATRNAVDATTSVIAPSLLAVAAGVERDAGRQPATRPAGKPGSATNGIGRSALGQTGSDRETSEVDTQGTSADVPKVMAPLVALVVVPLG